MRKHFLPFFNINSNNRHIDNHYPNIIIEREKNERVHIKDTALDVLKSQKFEKIDATQLTLQDSFRIFSNAKNIILPFKAETANLMFASNASVFLLVDRGRLTDLFLSECYDRYYTFYNRIKIIYSSTRIIEFTKY